VLLGKKRDGGSEIGGVHGYQNPKTKEKKIKKRHGHRSCGYGGCKNL